MPRMVWASAGLEMSYASMWAVPLVGLRRQHSIRMVVVLPAPLGPRRPKIWPVGMSTVKSSMAWIGPKCLESPVQVIMG